MDGDKETRISLIEASTSIHRLNLTGKLLLGNFTLKLESGGQEVVFNSELVSSQVDLLDLFEALETVLLAESSHSTQDFLVRCSITAYLFE